MGIPHGKVQIWGVKRRSRFTPQNWVIRAGLWKRYNKELMKKTSKSDGLSVVIPVYNSAGMLKELASQLAAELPLLHQNYEVIFVNDGSRDQSWEVIQQICQEYPWVQGFRLMRNYGQHNALLCGIRHARWDTIVTMDDDLQHPPSQIRLLLEELNKGFDVVYGPPRQEQHNLWRDAASVITKVALQNFMGAHSAQNISAFRAFRTHLREAFDKYGGSFISIDVLLTWATTRFSAVRVQHDPRKEGQSNYTFWKLVTHAVNMITGFSILPLQIASMIGFGFTFLGVLILLYVMINFSINGGAVPGFSFLASTITIFSGVQLFATGVIGEYLARIHFRMMDKPSYVVREQSQSEQYD